MVWNAGKVGQNSNRGLTSSKIGTCKFSGSTNSNSWSKWQKTKWRTVFDKKSCYIRENQCGGAFRIKESKFLVEKSQESIRRKVFWKMFAPSKSLKTTICDCKYTFSCYVMKQFTLTSYNTYFQQHSPWFTRKSCTFRERYVDQHRAHIFYTLHVKRDRVA